MDARQRLVLCIAIMASFVSFLDGSIVNVALPAISQDLGGGLALQQWVIDSYMITLGALMLLAGSFSDLFGRRKILTIGLVGFGITSILCAIAPNGPFLVLARGLQGAAGALLVPSSLALIISAFSGAAQGKAIGSWTAWTGMAFVFGSLLGGVLVDSFSWEWIFLVNVLPVAFTLWLIRKLDGPEDLEKGTRLDLRGAILGIIGLGGPVYALIEQGRYGWESPLIYLPLVIGLAIFAYFLRYERRCKNPMLPLDLFKVRNFSAGNLATLTIYGALGVAVFLITIFVQQYGDYSALEAGLSMLPVTVIMFFLSPRFGALAGRFGPRLFMATGPLIAAAGFLFMLAVDQSVNYWTQILPGILLFGIGLSATVAPLTSAVLGAVNSKQAGIASAVNNAVSRIAGLVTVAAIGLVTGVGSITLDGFRRGLIFTAVLLLIGGVTSAIGITNHQKAADAAKRS